MKEYSNDTLSLDDLLQDLKRHVGQADIIIGILKGRGAESSAFAMIRDYKNFAEAAYKFVVVNESNGDPYLWADSRPIGAVTREEAEVMADRINSDWTSIRGSENVGHKAVVKEL